MKVVQGQIIYTNNKNELVHSDFSTALSKAHLHKLLDEWLNKGKGSGLFIIGDSSYE